MRLTTLLAQGYLVGTASTVAGALLAESDAVAVNESVYDQVNLRLTSIELIPNNKVISPDATMSNDLLTAARGIKARLASVKPATATGSVDLVNALKPMNASETAVLKVIADPKSLYAAVPQELVQPNNIQLPATLDTNYEGAKNVPPLSNGTNIQSGWTAFVEKVNFAAKNEDLSQLKSFLTYEVSKNTQSKLSADDAHALRNAALTLAQAANAKVIFQTSFPTIIGPLVAPQTPSQKIFARAQDDLKKIAGLQADAATATDPKQKADDANKIDQLTEDFDDAIGAADEYKQIKYLEQFLASGPPTVQNAGRSSPLSEYNSARTQLEQLQNAVTLKLSTFATTNSQPTPSKPADWSPSPVEPAFLWNVQRESMENSPPLELPILVPKLEVDKDPSASENATARVIRRYGANPAGWPKFIVVLDKVKP